jgi:CheY-like chemotaxis protein
MPKKARDVRPILIVESDADGREMLRKLFEVWGHPVVTASSEREALRARTTHDPDIVVIGLPDAKSCGLIERIKAKGDGRLSIVAYSESTAVEAAARAAGADEFIVKPDVPKLGRLLLQPETGRDGRSRASSMSRKASVRRG